MNEKNFKYYSAKHRSKYSFYLIPRYEIHWDDRAVSRGKNKIVKMAWWHRDWHFTILSYKLYE